MKVLPEAVYLTDNGAAYCGDHLGVTAKATGRDLSGQSVLRVTSDDRKSFRALGLTIRCEQCGRPA